MKCGASSLITAGRTSCSFNIWVRRFGATMVANILLYMDIITHTYIFVCDWTFSGSVGTVFEFALNAVICKWGHPCGNAYGFDKRPDWHAKVLTCTCVYSYIVQHCGTFQNCWIYLWMHLFGYIHRYKMANQLSNSSSIIESAFQHNSHSQIPIEIIHYANFSNHSSPSFNQRCGDESRQTNHEIQNVPQTNTIMPEPTYLWMFRRSSPECVASFACGCANCLRIGCSTWTATPARCCCRNNGRRKSVLCTPMSAKRKHKRTNSHVKVDMKIEIGFCASVCQTCQFSWFTIALLKHMHRTGKISSNWLYTAVMNGKTTRQSYGTRSVGNINVVWTFVLDINTQRKQHIRSMNWNSNIYTTQYDLLWSIWSSWLPTGRPHDIYSDTISMYYVYSARPDDDRANGQTYTHDQSHTINASVTTATLVCSDSQAMHW